MWLGAGLCFLPSGALGGLELSSPLLLPAASSTAPCLDRLHLLGVPLPPCPFFSQQRWQGMLFVRAERCGLCVVLVFA